MIWNINKKPDSQNLKILIMVKNNFPEVPLVNKIYQLNKYPDKIGWIYVVIPEITATRHTFFSWVKVKGSIDGYEINNFHLMPLPDGTLYLPVKAEICQKIGKNAGDEVNVILFADQSPAEIPEELILALKINPSAYYAFQSLTESLQQGIIDWIFSTDNSEARAQRIAKTVDKLTG